VEKVVHTYCGPCNSTQKKIHQQALGVFTKNQKHHCD
jgi:hypothetical protein